MRLHPDFPIVSGEYRLSHDWRLTLPTSFNRRIDRRDLVIWRPGFRICLALWSWDPGSPPEERLVAIKSGTSPEAFDVRLEGEGPPIRYSYRLEEERDGGAVNALYAYVLKDRGYLQMAFHVDSEDDLACAESIVESVR